VCRERGITVCNIPCYSNEAVAHLVIGMILNFSSSLVAQQRQLFAGDRSNFTTAMMLPHFEIMGMTLGLVGGSGTIGQDVARIA
jgi:glycerate dehydrogenase